jgi:hypothetical protein
VVRWRICLSGVSGGRTVVFGAEESRRLVLFKGVDASEPEKRKKATDDI